jgi:hypothetical protein
VENEQFPVEGDGELPQTRAVSRKYPWAILVVIVLFVVIPFISWYGTWFGRPLSDSKMVEYLHDSTKPRNVQHALAQLGNRIIDHDSSAAKFYPDVLAASHHPQPEVRMTAAWVMGQDNDYQEFHTALRPMLDDESPGVRHNAALGLVRFGDPSGRKELVAMLEPFKIRSNSPGTVELIVKEEGTAVVANAPLARIKQDDGKVVEVHAPEAGRLESLSTTNGAKVESGADLMTLSPTTEQVWETLRALFLIGQSEDIPSIQRYTRPLPTMPDSVQKQATSTLEAIRDRASKSQ